MIFSFELDLWGPDVGKTYVYERSLEAPGAHLGTDRAWITQSKPLPCRNPISKDRMEHGTGDSVNVALRIMEALRLN